MVEKQRNYSREGVLPQRQSCDENRAVPVQRESQAVTAPNTCLSGSLLGPRSPHRQQTLDQFRPVRNSPQQVGAITQSTSIYALTVSPHEDEFTLVPDRPSSRVTTPVNAVATATQSKGVRASNKLSHKALADVLFRERFGDSEFFCIQCDNQAKCFIDLVNHFFEAERDKNIAEERLDMARAAYEFYIEQLDGLVKQHWVMNRATCSKCGLERDPRK